MTFLVVPKWSPCAFHIKYVLLLQILSAMCPAAVGKERIINGSTVNPPHKYPFMVSIWWDGCFVEKNGSTDCYPENAEHNCGATVLNKHWVLTAAHCCFIEIDDKKPSPQHFRVITGLHDREKLEPWSQNLSLVECIVHEGFQVLPFQIHDVALMRVNGTILFGDNVVPVNLPSCEFDVKRDGEILGTTLGWGKSKNQDVGLPRELQELEVPIVTLETCQRTYGWLEIRGPNKTRLNDSRVVTETMICAGGLDGAGTCTYDSGSPLIILDQASQTYTQVGIDAWGNKPCAQAGLYTGYTHVAKYVNWINSQVQRCKPRIT